MGGATVHHQGQSVQGQASARAPKWLPRSCPAKAPCKVTTGSGGWVVWCVVQHCATAHVGRASRQVGGTGMVFTKRCIFSFWGVAEGGSSQLPVSLPCPVLTRSGGGVRPNAPGVCVHKKGAAPAGGPCRATRRCMPSIVDAPAARIRSVDWFPKDGGTPFACCPDPRGRVVGVWCVVELTGLTPDSDPGDPSDCGSCCLCKIQKYPAKVCKLFTKQYCSNYDGIADSIVKLKSTHSPGGGGASHTRMHIFK